MMKRRCRHGDYEQQNGELYCPVHHVHLEAPREASVEPLAEPAVEAPAAVCWNCGTEAASPDNTRCARCNRDLADAPLRLRCDSGETIDVPRGESTRIGRDPTWSPHWQLMEQWTKVSRQHASVFHDEQRRGWITGETTKNGTWINDRQIPPGQATLLREGDEIRLGRDFRIVVGYLNGGGHGSR